MKHLIYDLEVFRNFVSYFITIIDTEKNEEINRSSYCVKINNAIQFEKVFLNNVRNIIRYSDQFDSIVGFNNSTYDDYLLSFIAKQKSVNHEQIYDYSQRLVNNDKSLKKVNLIKHKSIDLFKIFDLIKSFTSLKHCALVLNQPIIQDLPISFDSYVKQEDINTIMRYNQNDVDITKALFLKFKNEIDLRFTIQEEYKIRCISSSRSKIADMILNSEMQKHGIKISEIKDLRTHRKQIFLCNVIDKNIKFEKKEFNNILDTMLKIDLELNPSYEFNKQSQQKYHYYYDNKFKITRDGLLPLDNKIIPDEELIKSFGYGVMKRKTIKNKTPIMTPKIKNTIYVVATGGLHSMDRPKIFESNGDYILVDSDVASFYPNIILKNKIIPRHLPPEFIDVYSNIVSNRLRAKSNGFKIKADALKITINAVYGKFGFKHFYLYDEECKFKTTINGQLYLLRLCELAVLNNIEIYSVNTDGILFKIKKNQIDQHLKMCYQWESETGFKLEHNYYKKYAGKDVNNYIAVTEDGKVKQKGIFSLDVDITKGYSPRIIKKALIQYFTNNTPIEKTITSETNPLDFCMSQRIKSDYELYYNGIKQQKTLRCYITKDSSAKILEKVPTGKGNRSYLFSGKPVKILNEYNDRMIINDIDYNYYIQQTKSIVDIIDPPQKSLFG